MVLDRVTSVWRRAIRLGSPVVGQRAAGRIISSTDVFITAAISPAAVVALGVSEFYTSLPGRIGGGFLGASRTLIAQDTGAESGGNRNQAYSQAVLLYVLLSVPFVVGGVLYGAEILSLVGADAETVDIGYQYLLLVLPTLLLSGPTSASSTALEAMGDTTSPMYFSVPVDILNAAGSLVFGLGLLGAPRLGIVGIGGATLVARTVLCVLLVSYLLVTTEIAFELPRDTAVGRQLLVIGAPRSVAGGVTGLAFFPLNALLLQVGTVVNAGFQLAWRIRIQVMSPIKQGLSVATATIVGQALGEEEHAEARTAAGALLGLTLVASLLLCAVVAVAAGPLTRLLATDGATAQRAGEFLVFFGGLAVVGFTGSIGQAVLSAGSETRIPMVSSLVGAVVGMVGVTWLTVSQLGMGVTGVYLGLASMTLLSVVITAYGLVYTDWVGRAAFMLRRRGSTTE
jgi:putative MATE family efflux protein